MEIRYPVLKNLSEDTSTRKRISAELETLKKKMKMKEICGKEEQKAMFGWEKDFPVVRQNSVSNFVLSIVLIV